ncbi:MAG: dehydrogenase FmdD [Candidatus Methanofastidiosum methylothiophilum]|uniref:Dehydrogenase FmdD n=1 Tax=Candidatus Methanofastidiosum methylothiophilum TaxID=1705564 RepID=A0A150IM28_9EURY|nr:MAG: dehydrogenase FmdD [Candidatus Methanofastidiosum methylthiophilus]
MKEFKSLMPYAKALDLVRTYSKEFDSETIHIGDSLDRVASEDIFSAFDSPAFDRSAMDGYAIQAKDTFSISEGSHITLKVIDSVTAGKVSDKEVVTGTAIEIMTGAMIPKGADSVVMQEFTEIKNDEVKVYKKVFPYLHISRKGEDIRKGDLILKKGTIIAPEHLSLLKSLGIENIIVKKRPRISIIVTGDELVEDIDEVESGKIIDSNSIMLSSLIKKAMCEMVHQIRVADDQEEILNAISIAKKDSDIILITGGSSFGKKDFLPKIVDNIILHGVTIKPGKPIGFASHDIPLFIMSGYPVASFVQFYLFVVPYLENILKTKLLKSVELSFAENYSSELGRVEFVRCILKDNEIIPIRLSGSGVISSISNSSGYVLINENTEGVNKGERCRFYYYL